MLANQSKVNFSIIICCYNSEKFLTETLESVVKQTYPFWELVLVNDGSIDKTETIIKKFISNNKKYEINYINQKNSGLANSRNIAVKNSKYDWIAILDHDDILEINRLENQKNDIFNNPNSHLFFGNLIQFNKERGVKIDRFLNYKKKENFNPSDLNLSKKNGYRELVLRGCFIGSSCTTFSKYAYNKIGKFDPKYIFITDYIFFLELSKLFDIYCTNKILVNWRMHPDQSTVSIDKIYQNEMIELFYTCYQSSDLLVFDKLKILKRHISILIKKILKI